MGEPTDDETYPQICREFVQIIYGRGSERRAAAIEGADQPATFIALSNSGTRQVGTKNLVMFDGDFWDIVNVAPLGRVEIEFTAIRRSR
ncbi:hypothetical protein HT136_01660 [Novosphingobium profundi]|uniref:hypothetical protein n=1 Tax=Novosphingobium profundi TaxID=1774954 RepID=UPI001BDB2ED2|nr:hypothetical protein [Novosphingobium profundi]MBT0667073.1 hypothetical protein [Novosphingobium profundi]MED5546124.1 hypothetical protein [Pseudomonadota bacterium]MEE3155108.1 hypothetical protein [Pseudomonadota bacterium]